MTTRVRRRLRRRRARWGAWGAPGAPHVLRDAPAPSALRSRRRRGRLERVEGGVGGEETLREKELLRPSHELRLARALARPAGQLARRVRTASVRSSCRACSWILR